METKISNLSNDELSKILKESKSFREVLINLGYSSNGSGAYSTLKNHLKKLGLTIPKYNYYGQGTGTKIPLSEILVENSNYQNRSSLKRRLIKERILEYKCYGKNCSVKSEWLGKKISLQLEHKNGVNNDNRIENLTLLCPNCHSQSDTFGGRNNKIYDTVKDRNIKKYKENINSELKSIIDKKKKYCKCGSEIYNSSNSCKKCNDIKQRKIKERPNLETLLMDIQKLGYIGSGKKYNVSDNTIRKWIKYAHGVMVA